MFINLFPKSEKGNANVLLAVIITVAVIVAIVVLKTGMEAVAGLGGVLP